jgi:molybdopterin/thiamine biosynthesis adenylyltransferase
METEGLKVGIAGAGGIGSWLTHFLFEFGVSRKQFDFMNMEIDVYDDDTIDQKNLLHQNFKIDDLGKHKVSVLQKKYAINPKKKFMEEKDLKKYDVIFSCVDGMEFRKTLYEYSWEHPKLFWIDGRCTSRNGIVLNSKITKSAQQKFLDDSTERAGCLLAYEKENNISHALPIVVASTMTQLFLNHIRGDKVVREKLILL